MKGIKVVDKEISVGDLVLFEMLNDESIEIVEDVRKDCITTNYGVYFTCYKDQVNDSRGWTAGVIGLSSDQIEKKKEEARKKIVINLVCEEGNLVDDEIKRILNEVFP